MKKILLINITVFIFILTIIEIIFGYWFKDNNFGIYVRSERNVKEIISFEHNENKLKHIYIRNFYAFRGEDFKPSEVQIVFLGGSGGNQRLTPENLTIVGNLNLFLKNDNTKLKIYNASTDGKSTRGYVNDFLYWFPKIPNFKPKVFIFYIGVNDSNPYPEWAKHYDLKLADNTILKIRDYIKNNSFTFELIKKVEDKYLPKVTSAYVTTNENLYENFNFIDFSEAKKKYSNIELNNQEKKMVVAFKNRLINLNIQILKYNIYPIFITQIQYDGLRDHYLFLIIQELKKFCEENDYSIIALDEITSEFDKNDFYDTVHTTAAGSKKIAKIIYPKLVKILKQIGL